MAEEDVLEHGQAEKRVVVSAGRARFPAVTDWMDATALGRTVGLTVPEGDAFAS